MRNETDFSSFLNNAPIIKISISKIEIQIRIFFGITCCEIMFEQYEQTNNYRTAFAKTVFYMYQQTLEDNRTALSENDFITTTDENLQTVLNQILEQDNKVKIEYNKNETENIYERFYKANEVILKSEKITKTLSALNTPLLTTLTNAIRTTVFSPPDYLAGLTSRLTSVVTNIPTYDFPKDYGLSQFQSAFVNIPKIQFPKLASTLSSIPHVAFDIHEIISPLQHVLERVQLVSESLAQKLKAPLLQMAKTAQSLASSIDFSLLVYHKEWTEERETLLKYGWFYSTALPDELADYIHENQEELSVDDVDKVIVNYFRQNKCKALKNMVRNWRELPYFLCREQIFHEALVNHSRKYFNTSVTLLTIHTEGIITDFVRTTLNNPRFHVEKAIDDIKQELAKNTDASIFEYEVFSDVIERLEDAFNENFKLSDPDATSNKSRHKIAHGHAYEKENEVNSLKRFLYLNEIYSLFALLSSRE